MALDFASDVVAIASQPFRLTWRDGDKVRRHVPDYFARRRDGSAVVIDVRPDERIKKRDAEVFEQTRQACEQAGWSFQRLGVLDEVFAANLRWLAGYRHPRCYCPDSAALPLEVFSKPTGLLTGAQHVGDRLKVLPVLYHLLWKGELTADLHRYRLDASTIA